MPERLQWEKTIEQMRIGWARQFHGCLAGSELTFEMRCMLTLTVFTFTFLYVENRLYLKRS